MQITEIGELRNVIEILRIASHHSPYFQDGRDSEVDQLLKSSPKTNLPMLSDEEQQLIAQQMTLTSHASPNKVLNESRKSNGSHSNVEKAGIDAMDFQTIGSDGEITNEKIELTIAKEDILLADVKDVSMLALELKGNTLGEQRFGPPLSLDPSKLCVTIYLTNGNEMKAELNESATVEEAIECILSSHLASAKDELPCAHHVGCYELRLHDQDGLPDEDFPALDRSRKIGNFGDAGNHEYCLCRRSHKCLESGGQHSSSISSSALDKSSLGNAATNHVQNKKHSKGQKFIKVHLPSEDYAVVAIGEDATGHDLLPMLKKKHRIHLKSDECIIKMSSADQQRLNLPADEVHNDKLLFSLDVTELSISTRKYADAPAKRHVVVAEPVNTDCIESRPKLDSFLFDDANVKVYKEWGVIKRNRYGKQQPRVLGLDATKIYNKMVGEQAIKSKTMNAERLLSTILDIEFLQNPCEFSISFRGHEIVQLEYTTTSPYECAEIVARIKYILARKLYEK